VKGEVVIVNENKNYFCTSKNTMIMKILSIKTKLLAIFIILLGVGICYAQPKTANYYCKWCGNKYSSVSSLTSG